MNEIDYLDFFDSYPHQEGVIHGPHVIPLPEKILNLKWQQDVTDGLEPMSDVDYLKRRELEENSKAASFAMRERHIGALSYQALMDDIAEAQGQIRIPEREYR